jgi:hypothetical protein
MRRGMTACAGWAAFAGVLWLWSAGAGGVARPGSSGSIAVDDGTFAAAAAPAHELSVRVDGSIRHEPHVFVLKQAPAGESGPVKARFRVTLETLSDATARSDVRPGEDVALAIQAAAARDGRSNWFTADWTADGKLDSADIAAFVAAYRAGLSSADLNRDGVVDERDFSEFIREFRVSEARPVAPLNRRS